MPNLEHIPTLSTSALLFDISFSVWTGRKQDKNATREVTNNKKAAKDAASVTKYLMAGTDKLNKIVAYTQQVRHWVNTNTLPWSDTGTRLLPAEKFMEFKDEPAGMKVSNNLNDYKKAEDSILNSRMEKIIELRRNNKQK